MAVVDNLVQKAASLFDNKDFAGALKQADEALQQDADSVSAHWLVNLSWPNKLHLYPSSGDVATHCVFSPAAGLAKHLSVLEI